MAKVYVRKGQNFEQVLRVFKKQMIREHIIDDYKKHSHYEKPSETARKRRFERKAIARRVQRWIDKQ
jgi:ribosomal protein S21